MIIQIIGIAGSGKSYICNKLNNVICIDTDDYFTKAYNILAADINKKITDKKITSLANKLFETDIKNAHNKTVVITGITLKSKKLDRLYFIKMDKIEIELAYRRVIKRELSKYIQLTDREVIDNIETMNPNKIQLYLYYTYIMGIDPITMTFDKYKKKYNNSLKKHKNDGSIIMSQIDIINDINKIE